MMAMMTGRVLLVCALCVLWCGAGGVYARDLDNKALGGCMASGVLGMNASYVPNGCNKYMPTPPLRSALPIPAIQAEVGQVSVTPPDSGSGGGGGGSPGAPPVPGGAAAPSGPAVPGVPAVPNAGDSSGSEGDSPRPAAGDLHSQSDDAVITSSDLSNTHSGSREEVLQQEETETHNPSPSKGLKQEALPDVQQPQTSASENSKTGCDAEASNCGSQGKLGKATMEKQDLEESKTQESPPTKHKESNGNEENPTEASSTESQNTETQQEIKTPVDESDSTGTDASIAVAAQSTSAGSQEEATESSSNGSHSPLQGEVFTGTDTPENAPSPGAAETEKRQGENVTKDGDSDSSTAASHTTSPLLLLLVACAAAVVAA
ncbi:mucin-associated surface protein (MASP), putative [Trypanosoma cruzi]|uniref:Mucin-associated surface protein (MASP), putative n=1 Tax=Trypanosoma cruzi (strain CL Brener) TaxID=353153 RepID=Q4DVY8_TRYCC|nr:mucin-associated surface protein (MASP), putative [Trypanosoma cruzi]EAN96695.1 mucin-associated surface protein (MASP), putative [Trypanosoma cruzi]|eukprot:XP_818546.1 mucin-associated surface protein (MASP) [Trypanosoma cruzi strain CL Brener]